LRYYVLWVLVFLLSPVVRAQLNATIIGDAINQGNNCYTITQNLEFQSGGVWYDNPIDFDEDFTILYQNNFGSLDANGADGMALVFKRTATPQLGNAGGGLAYEGISPSLVIEFDTFQNGDLGDPAFDHISIMRNGNPNHNNGASNLSGPIQASATSVNIEDGDTHEIKIEWIAATNRLNVYFDCVLRLTLNQDVKTTIFSGDDSVFFGFVGSTGGFTNIHEVCFNSISFVDNLQLQDEFICLGSSMTVDASIPSGSTYSWSPTTGISNPNIPNPVFSPTVTTTYTVTISDVCGDTTVEEFTLSVLPVEDPVFNPIAAICAGDALAPLPTTSLNGITGSWSPNLNNTQTTTYTFTPDNPCATTTTLEVVVNPLRIPTFNAVDAICEGDMLAPLPTISNNGIEGTWSPPLNNTATTTYTFTPNDTSLCEQQTSLEIVVIPLVVPEFNPIAPICEGDTIAELPEVSNNGIAGSWSPAFDNTQTTLYTFTPNANECAEATTLLIEVIPITIPQFDTVIPFCQGSDIPQLPSTSNNGISGSWSPQINNNQTTTYTFTPNADECAIEVELTIEIIPSIVPVFDAVGTICPGQFIEPLPTVSNNGITGSWSPELDNTQTTTYTFTPDPNQGCAVTTTLEIIVSDPVIPEFDEVDFICAGDSSEGLLPLVSLNGISGTWFPEFNNEQSTTYTFTPNPNQCSVETTLTIEVVPIAELLAEVELISTPFDDNQSVRVLVTGGTGNYEYKLDNETWVQDPVFNRISGCQDHVIAVRETSGCSNIALATFRIFEFPKFFTPNGDGINDVWNIGCIDNQTNAVITIFDRFGKILIVINPAQSGWDGRYNGELMSTNDYWFKVDYLDEAGVPRTFSSHFTLKR
jgi:gliding motility-associated-like protein